MGALLTKEGGLAVQMVNNTGADSVKGTLVHASESISNAADLANLAGFDTIGVVYNDGSRPGEEMWVVVSGLADVLLEDNTAATHGNWTRTSGVQQGRANAASSGIPGETIGDSITLTRGTVGAGSLANTSVEDAIYLQLNSAGGNPQFDVVFDFTLDSAPDSFSLAGWMNSEDSDTVLIQAYNYLTSGWETKATMTDRASAALFYFSLGSAYYDAANNLARIRLYQAAGGDNGRVYIDQMVMSTTTATHFKEIGHCLESVTAGTDKLALCALHFN